SANVPTNNNIALARYNANGSLDSSFGSAGKVTTSYTSIPGSIGNTQVNSVGVEPDGKIVVFGATEFVAGPNPIYHPFIARYTTSGGLDTTFGGSGIVVLAQVPEGQAQVAWGVVQGDGRLVVAAEDDARGQDDLARFNLDGSLDST